ncbi:hypothetical protein BDV19DRAFT_396463 [Aspergillus venezuelensis]
MTAPVVLITGANTGIGFEIVRALSSSTKPYHILVGARSCEKASNAIIAVQKEYPTSTSTYSFVVIDIEQDELIQSAFEQILSAHGKLDVLINNAGAQLETKFTSGEITTKREPWDRSTSIPLLLKSSDLRILFITSGTSTLAGSESQAIPINHIPSAGWPKATDSLRVRAYRSSKAGPNMLMREWHRILKEDGVKVFGISPGYLATGLGGDASFNKKMGAGHSAVAGPSVQSVVEGQRDEDAGKVLTRFGIQESLFARKAPCGPSTQ